MTQPSLHCTMPVDCAIQHPDSECECRCHRRDGVPFDATLRPEPKASLAGPSKTLRVSQCCQAPIFYDATREFCSSCRRVLNDLNNGDAYDQDLYECPDCGGNGFAGGLDDMTCETCEGEGQVDG